MHRLTRIVLAALLIALAVTAGFAPGAKAQQPPVGYYIVTYFETSPRMRAQAETVLKQLTEDSRKDAGNLRFEALEQLHDGGRFAILEAWKDKAAAEAHAAAAHTKQARDSLQPMLTAPYDERVQATLSVAGPQIAFTDRTIWVITHADFIPPRQEEGIAVSKDIVEAGRKEHGNMRFEVMQQPQHPNHLTIVEVWDNNHSRVAHLTSDTIKTYRNKILPMLGALYDERLYRPAGEPPRRR